MIQKLRLCGRVALSLALALGVALPSRSVRAESVRVVDLASNDIVFDAGTNAIYASVPGGARERGNTLTPINPTTGALGSSVFVGSEPGKLARSDNGQYLYVALGGAAAVRRFDLASQTAGLQFGLGSNSFLGSIYAEDIEVVPGSPGSVAVSLKYKGVSPRAAGVAVFDEGVKRPKQTSDFGGNNVIEFGSLPSVLYGYNNETTGFDLSKLAVDASGVSSVSSKGNLISGFNVDIRYDNGLLYSTNGAVVDPEAGTLLGTFPNIGFNSNVRPDSASGRVFFVTGRDSTLTLKAYDMRTFTLVGSLPIAGAKGEAASLIRWGADGLAFRTDGQIFLVQSSLIGTSQMLSLTVAPSSFAENAGASAAVGTITRTGNTSQPLTVQLSSSRAGEAGVPESVTIPAGAASVSFAIAAVDDAVADGSQAVTINASANGFSAASAQVTVTDNDVASLSLGLSPNTFSEAAGASASTGTVTRNTPTDAALTVTLSSSDTSVATVPETVTIPSGQKSATFAIAAVDDTDVNGPRAVTITATAPNIATATATATVTDNDVAPLALSLSISPSTLDENAALANQAPARGRVSRAVASTTPLAVRLASSDLSELRVLPFVIIPAGQLAAEFTVTPVDDLVADGAQRVTVTASASGYANRAAIVVVRDNEAPALSVTVAPARIEENGAATIIIRRNSEVSATTSALQVALSASPAGQVSLPAFVTIPARATAVAVRVTAVDDAATDGPRTVTITARATGLAAGTATLVVQDNEAASNLSLGGRVTAVGGMPVAGALLTLKQGSIVLDTAVSSASGAYAFSKLPRGSYQVLISKPGAVFATAARAVTLSQSLSTVNFVATLRPQITGRVLRRNANGTTSPASGVLVTARAGSLSFSVRTNSLGQFLFDRLPLGLFTVSPAPTSGTSSPISSAVLLDAANPVSGSVLFTLPPTAAAAPARAVGADDSTRSS